MTSSSSTPNAAESPPHPDDTLLVVSLAGRTPLAEFQISFARQLADALIRQNPDFPELPGGTLEDTVLTAVLAVTDEHWHAKRSRTWERDAEGRVLDGATYHGATRAVEPVAPLRAVEVSVTYVREETPTERERRQRGRDALKWEVGDQSTPPPLGVGILTLLEQDTWWRTRGGDSMLVGEMTPTHRANLLDFLRRNAPALHAAEMDQFMAMASGPMGPSGDMACDAVDREFDGLINMSAETWLKKQPLVIKLRELVEHESTPVVCAGCGLPRPGVWKKKAPKCTAENQVHGPWVLLKDYAPARAGAFEDGATP